MTFMIDGTDVMPFIAFGGLRWQRVFIEGPNSGYLMSGDMQLDRIATKARWDVSCRALTGAELAEVLQLIEPEYVTLTYTDPTKNAVVSGTFHTDNFPVNFVVRQKNGVEYWSGLTFPLIER